MYHTATARCIARWPGICFGHPYIVAQSVQPSAATPNIIPEVNARRHIHKLVIETNQSNVSKSTIQSINQSKTRFSKPTIHLAAHWALQQSLPTDRYCDGPTPPPLSSHHPPRNNLRPRHRISKRATVLVDSCFAN